MNMWQQKLTKRNRIARNSFFVKYLETTDNGFYKGEGIQKVFK